MGLTVGSIAEALGATAAGDLSLPIDRLCEPQDARPGLLALAIDAKYEDDLKSSKAEAAVVWTDADWQALGLQAAIFAPRSRYVMAGLGRVFERPLDLTPGAHPTAYVEEGVTLGPGSSIGAFSYVAAGTKIGPNAQIMNHVSIGADVVIGEDALLHPHVHIGARVVIGDRFIAQPGAVIGGDGFSYVSPSGDAIKEARDTGQITEASRTPGFARINSLGAVRIGDDVEIGANAAIDRGTVADTTVGNGTKIDDLVDVGHNVQIGQHCLLCGQVGIAGSTVIGDRVVLAGQVGVGDHINIGSDVIIAAGSGVGNNIKSGCVMMGYPAIPMDKNIEIYKALRRLPRSMTRLAELEKRVPLSDPKD
ncbi:MAG: UDP-3-O-(3-hydroxymyristoyl)glucosamine N-acyltransferase [Pseudomonadota bacterium]